MVRIVGLCFGSEIYVDQRISPHSIFVCSQGVGARGDIVNGLGIFVIVLNSSFLGYNMLVVEVRGGNLCGIMRKMAVSRGL